MLAQRGGSKGFAPAAGPSVSCRLVADWLTSGRHLVAFGRDLEAPGRHLRDRCVLERKCVKTHMFFCQKLRDRPFGVDGSAVILEKSAGCAQKFAYQQRETSAMRSIGP